MLKTDSLIFNGNVKYFTTNKFWGAVWKKICKQKIEDCLLSKII